MEQNAPLNDDNRFIGRQIPQSVVRGGGRYIRRGIPTTKKIFRTKKAKARV